MQHDTVREALVARRREVMTRYYGALRRAEEELDSDETEDVERATEQWDARVLSELSHADLRELVRLTNAIRRIDDGTYGDCVDCGQPILQGRLQAIPAAELCTDCAFAAEARAMH